MKLFITLFIVTWLKNNTGKWKMIDDFLMADALMDRVLGFLYLSVIVYLIIGIIEMVLQEVI